MAFSYDTIKNWQFPIITQTYTAKDSILYALGIGIGYDPLDTQQLKFLYETELQTVPSMFSVLCYPGFWMRDPAAGVDWVKIVHGEQRLRVHHPLPPHGTLIGHGKITHVIDKGEGKGAIVVAERNIHLQDGPLLATVQQITFCRGDGGLTHSDEPLPTLQAVPSIAPDQQCTLPIAENAALIYRLSGDYNPLHIDPEVASKAGFTRPILHGLASYGMAAHAIIKSFCNYDSGCLRALNARFSAPVYPGETLIFDMWQTAPNCIQFQARSIERDVIVMSHGHAEFVHPNKEIL